MLCFPRLAPVYLTFQNSSKSTGSDLPGFTRMTRFFFPVVTMWSPRNRGGVCLSANNRKSKLTKRTADAAVPSHLRYIGWDSVLPGLGLREACRGTKTFMLRYL